MNAPATTQTGYGVYTGAGAAGSGNARGNDAVLGKDAFFRLLTTQLRYQDPTNPVDDKEFLAQMAQFSALEQMQNLTVTMEQYVLEQRQGSLLAQAVSLLGLKVEVQGASQERYIGVVEAVQMLDGVPRLLIGDTLFQLRDVVNIYHA